MQHGTDHSLTPHHPGLREPSYAQQVLTVTARVLDMQATCGLGPTVLDEALRTGIRSIVGPLPEPVRADVRRIVYGSLPKATLNDTQGEYALRLRQVAEAV